LVVSCIEYLMMSDGRGGLDYVRLLALITDLLEKKIAGVLDERGKQADKMVLVYGGAMHNDVFPRAELRDYSYAKAVRKRTKGRYVEIDLYVPEYIEQDQELTRERWYPLVAGKEPGKTALVRRAAGSFIVVFQCTP